MTIGIYGGRRRMGRFLYIYVYSYLPIKNEKKKKKNRQILTLVGRMIGQLDMSIYLEDPISDSN